MAELTIGSQTITNCTAVTTLAGEMDEGNFGLLEDEFNKLLESGVTGLVLDVSGLDGVTSAGIGALLNMSQLLEAKGGKLIVTAAKPEILGIVEILGLRETLSLADTAEQAKKLIASVKCQ